MSDPIKKSLDWLTDPAIKQRRTEDDVKRWIEEIQTDVLDAAIAVTWDTMQELDVEAGSGAASVRFKLENMKRSIKA
jgi:hypothetical protein